MINSDILTPERLAEIAARAEEARAATGWETVDYAAYAAEAPIDTLALLASHAALQAEVERLRDSVSWRRVAERCEQEKLSARESAAREMLLWCPSCGERHIDEPPFDVKPHHTHACQNCGMCWRPAVCNTVGVQFLPGFKNAKENADG